MSCCPRPSRRKLGPGKAEFWMIFFFFCSESKIKHDDVVVTEEEKEKVVASEEAEGEEADHAAGGGEGGDYWWGAFEQAVTSVSKVTSSAVEVAKSKVIKGEVKSKMT